MSQKVDYAYKIFNPVINEFSPNEVRIYLHIFYHSIVTFVIRGLCLGFSDTSHVDSLDRFINSVVGKFKTGVYIYL